MLQLGRGFQVFGIGCLALTLGCGRAPVASEPAAPPEPTSASPSASPSASQTEVETEAEVVSFPSEPTARPEPSPTHQGNETAALGDLPATAVQPATARQTLELINLQTLPKLNLKQDLAAAPTSIFYSADSTLPQAETFYKEMLTEAGWREIPNAQASTDQYLDRLYVKNGYYLRLTISGRSDAQEIHVNVHSLGNVDVRTLPRLDDAQAQDSSPIVGGFRTALSIADAAEQLTSRMVEAGWQEVIDQANQLPEVPHYRSMRFRRNAMRVNLGLTKNPTEPGAEVVVFYHAETAMPMDVPLLDHRRPVEVDATGSRARLAWEGDRPGLVALLENHGQLLEWHLVNKQAYLEQKATALYIKTLPAEGTDELVVGLAVRYVESKGSYWIDMQRTVLPRSLRAAEPAVSTN